MRCSKPSTSFRGAFACGPHSNMASLLSFTAASGVGSTSKVAQRRHTTRVAATCDNIEKRSPQDAQATVSGRRALLQAGLAAVAVLQTSWVPKASAMTSDLCDEECAEKLAGAELQTTESGLQYVDIVPGKGPNPPIGYQVVANYVAMTPEGRVFDSSLSKGRPYDLRVGAGQVVAGLDEGLLGMRAGGIRRVFVPGDLAFPKGLPSGPGRARVPPSSPVVFDVQLLYIPGFDPEDEY